MCLVLSATPALLHLMSDAVLHRLSWLSIPAVVLLCLHAYLRCSKDIESCCCLGGSSQLTL